VCPPALALPSELARASLRAVGIRPGVAVFESSPEPTARIVRNDCIELDAVDAQGGRHRIAPPGECATRGARLRIPWTEGLLRSVVLRAPPGVAEAALGDWVCHAPRFAAWSPRAMELVWREPWLDRRSRAEGIENVALLVWRCAPPGLAVRALHPTDAALGARRGDGGR